MSTTPEIDRAQAIFWEEYSRRKDYERELAAKVAEQNPGIEDITALVFGERAAGELLQLHAGAQDSGGADFSFKIELKYGDINLVVEEANNDQEVGRG